MDGDSYAEVEEQLKKAREDMIRLTKEGREVEVQSLGNGAAPNANGEGQGETCFALVLNGHSLVSGRG